MLGTERAYGAEPLVLSYTPKSNTRKRIPVQGIGAELYLLGRVAVVVPSVPDARSVPYCAGYAHTRRQLYLAIITPPPPTIKTHPAMSW
eukprot:1349377-Rhodomonas_salina.1